jgi:hypothetical protein
MLSNIKRLLAVCAVVAAIGCAPAYNCYECGCTPYDYCRRAPLPYNTYDSCCQTPIARSYSWSSQPSPHLEETGALSVEPIEAPTPPGESQ